MKSLIVYAHPEPKSFNGALKDKRETLEAQGYEVKVSDLYAMDFDPVARKDFKNLTDPEFFKYAVEQKCI